MQKNQSAPKMQQLQQNLGTGTGTGTRSNNHQYSIPNQPYYPNFMSSGPYTNAGQNQAPISSSASFMPLQQSPQWSPEILQQILATLNQQTCDFQAINGRLRALESSMMVQASVERRVVALEEALHGFGFDVNNPPVKSSAANTTANALAASQNLMVASQTGLVSKVDKLDASHDLLSEKADTLNSSVDELSITAELNSSRINKLLAMHHELTKSIDERTMQLSNATASCLNKSDHLISCTESLSTDMNSMVKRVNKLEKVVHQFASNTNVAETTGLELQRSGHRSNDSDPFGDGDKIRLQHHHARGQVAKGTAHAPQGLKQFQALQRQHQPKVSLNQQIQRQSSDLQGQQHFPKQGQSSDPQNQHQRRSSVRQTQQQSQSSGPLGQQKQRQSSVPQDEHQRQSIRLQDQQKGQSNIRQSQLQGSPTFQETPSRPGKSAGKQRLMASTPQIQMESLALEMHEEHNAHASSSEAAQTAQQDVTMLMGKLFDGVEKWTQEYATMPVSSLIASNTRSNRLFQAASIAVGARKQHARELFEKSDQRGFLVTAICNRMVTSQILHSNVFEQWAGQNQFALEYGMCKEEVQQFCLVNPLDYHGRVQRRSTLASMAEMVVAQPRFSEHVQSRVNSMMIQMMELVGILITKEQRIRASQALRPLVEMGYMIAVRIAREQNEYDFKFNTFGDRYDASLTTVRDAEFAESPDKASSHTHVVRLCFAPVVICKVFQPEKLTIEVVHKGHVLLTGKKTGGRGGGERGKVKNAGGY